MQPDDGTASEVLSAAVVDTERHTRFLSAMIGLDKAFRLPSTVLKPDGTQVELDKKYTQAE